MSKKRTRGNGLGSVYEYKPGRYRWQLRDADGKTIASGVAPNKTQAMKDQAKAQTDHTRGILAKKNGITLKEYAAQWLTRQTVRPNTRNGYAHDLGYIFEVMPKAKIQTTRPNHIKEALQKLAKREMQSGLGKGRVMSTRTLGMIRARLKSIFEDALRDGLIYVNPVGAVKPVKTEADPEEHTGIALDFDQVARLHELGTHLHDIGMCRLWPAIFTAVSVGLRRGEVMGLRWCDLDFAKNTLSVRQNLIAADATPTLGKPKTKGSIRDIPMTSSLRAMLETHKGAQLEERKTLGLTWDANAPVFATEVATYTHPDNLARALRGIVEWSTLEAITRKQHKKDKDGKTVIQTKQVTYQERLLAIPTKHRAKLEAITKAGKPLPMNLSPHDLRHTAGTLMLRKKMPLEVVSKILGHAKVSITLDVYRHVHESEKVLAMVDLFETPPPVREVLAITPN